MASTTDILVDCTWQNLLKYLSYITIWGSYRKVNNCIRDFTSVISYDREKSYEKQYNHKMIRDFCFYLYDCASHFPAQNIAKQHLSMSMSTLKSKSIVR